MTQDQHPEPATGDPVDTLGCEWIYRPLSRPLTAPLVRLGVAPNAVTSLTLLLAVVMPFWVLARGADAFWGVAILALLIEVFDCVDGNVARATGRATLWGKHFDDLSGAISESAKLISLGLLIDASTGGTWGLTLGLAAAVVGMTNQASSGHIRLPPGPNPVGPNWRRIARGVDSFYGFLLIAAGLLDRLAWLLVGLTAYRALRLGYTQYSLRRRVLAEERAAGMR